MKLMTNGCSFTEGVYDNFDEYTAWPYQLKDKLGYDLDQLAMGGGSNARIFRTTMEYLLDNKPDLVVIGWTQHDRSELPYYDGDIIRVMHSMAMPERNEEILDIPEMREFWYRYCDNNLTMLERTVYYIRVLQSHLDALKIKYLMFNALQNDYLWQLTDKNHPITKQMNTTIGERIDKIDKTKWIKWGSSMENHLHDYPKADKYGHPDLSGHTVWSEILYEEIWQQQR